jgi:hypothetical protein
MPPVQRQEQSVARLDDDVVGMDVEVFGRLLDIDVVDLPLRSMNGHDLVPRSLRGRQQEDVLGPDHLTHDGVGTRMEMPVRIAVLVQHHGPTRIQEAGGRRMRQERKPLAGEGEIAIERPDAGLGGAQLDEQHLTVGRTQTRQPLAHALRLEHGVARHLIRLRVVGARSQTEALDLRRAARAGLDVPDLRREVLRVGPSAVRRPARDRTFDQAGAVLQHVAPLERAGIEPLAVLHGDGERRAVMGHASHIPRMVVAHGFPPHASVARMDAVGARLANTSDAKRAMGNAGPGSIFRPGAISSCPSTASKP